MIIKCQECNGNVSDTAKLCPHCGYTFNPVEVVSPLVKTELGEKNINVSIGILLIVLGIIGIIGGIFSIIFVVGILPLIGGIVLIISGASRITGTHDCECPYCGFKSIVGASASYFNCRNCKRMSTRSGDFLESIN